MPSLQHELLTRLLPLLRRNPSPDDLPKLRATLAEENRKVTERPPRGVRKGRNEHVSTTHGFPVVTLSRGGSRPQRSLLYLHGGAYVRPSDPRHWSFATRLADAIDADVVFPAYPLAPEYTVADSFDELVRLFDEVSDRAPGGVVLAGDSAGGGYALALAEALRDRRGPQPAQLLLLAPWVDLTGATPGIEEAARRDPWLSRPHLDVYAALWAGSAAVDALADPRVSPGLGDLRGLPPALMFCGTRDLLQPGCEALFERAEQTDWELTYVRAPGLLHVYPLLPVPEAAKAFDQCVAFFN